MKKLSASRGLRYCAALLLICFSFTLWAQKAAKPPGSLPAKNNKKGNSPPAVDSLQYKRLAQIRLDYENWQRSQQQFSENFMRKNRLPGQQEHSLKKFRIKEFQNGRPLFYGCANDTSARSISTPAIRSGGSAGLNLSGVTKLIGMWDDGRAFDQHQEFIYTIGGQVGPPPSRVNQLDTPGIAFNAHATHVAGTMIAQGTLARARGMAPAALVNAYDFQNDVREMTTAVGNGLKLSNHSYIGLSGWVINYAGLGGWGWAGDTAISKEKDFAFGYYDTLSMFFDRIAYSSPDYTICVSAGNDGNDTFPRVKPFWFTNNNGQLTLTDTTVFKPGRDGPYDCIPRGASVSKNVITVGSVKDIPNGYTQPSDISISAFSSWGPVDDGRIKPDIVANGDSVFSCGAGQSSYYYTFGTSMACPAVTGSLALLQELYTQTHAGQNILAATLKGLVIHTADRVQANTVAPDYTHGWGLMNSLKAAQMIQADSSDPGRMQELSLSNGGNISQTIYCDGSQALKVTICWTDPAAAVRAEALDDRTAHLVNDLDLRVLSFKNGFTYMPFKLDPNNPASAATQGDNTVDNVEYVFIANPPAGFYTISIGHKGVLVNDLGQNSGQNFSLLISGASSACSIPSLTSVNAPQGNAGQTITLLGSGFNSSLIGAPGTAGLSFGQVAGTVSMILPNGSLAQGVVPMGSQYAPVTFTTACGYSAESNLPFAYTYPCRSSLDTSSLNTSVNFGTLQMPQQIAMADLDLDGRLEMLALNSIRDTLLIYRHPNPGSGTIDSNFFPLIARIALPTVSGGMAVSMAIDDLNADGKPDIVLANRGANSISVFENASLVPPLPPVINFSTSFSLSTPNDPVDVSIRDLDLDGQKDIAVACYSSSFISVFRNVHSNGAMGVGSFLSRVDIPTPSNPTTIECGDLDQDNRPEIIVGNNDLVLSFDSITVFRNMTRPGTIMAGMLGAWQNFQAGLNHRGLATGDLNMDGKLDIVVANGNSSNFSVLENNGALLTLSLAPKVDFGVMQLQNPSGICITELDGDGSADIVVSDQASSTVLVYEDSLKLGAIGPNFFRYPLTLNAGMGVRSPVAGDLNLDGQADLVSLDMMNQQFTVFENHVRPYDPHIVLTYNNDTLCEGDFAQLQVLPQDSSYIYEWWRNDSAGIGSSASCIASKPGWYSASVKNAFGCVRYSPPVYIHVWPLPVVDAGPDDTLYFEPDTVLVSGFSPAGGTWSGTGVSTDGVFDPVQSGRGKFKLYYLFNDSNGCSNLDSMYMIVIDSADAGILAIDTILGHTCNTVSAQMDVYAVLKNYGRSPLAKVNIRWTLNQVQQTDYAWSGLLESGESLRVKIGQQTFYIDSAYDFKAWTEHPNDSIDLDHANDTASIQLKRVRKGLSGTYTIGIAQASYTSFSAAVTDLKAYGVCDSVLFRVYNGTYQEQIRIPAIAGVSVNTPVKFRSWYSDSSVVKLNYGVSTHNDSNYTLFLDGARHIRFEYMSISRSDQHSPSGPTCVVLLKNGADSNSLLHNKLSGTNGPVVYSTGFTANNANKIIQNLVKGGIHALSFSPTDANLLETGNQVENNIIDSFSLTGINLEQQRAANIRANKITGSLETQSAGIYLYKCGKGMKIHYNKLELPKAWLGIASRYSLASNDSHTVISNNFIMIGDENIHYYQSYAGLELSYCAYHDAIYNSVNLVSPYNNGWGNAMLCQADDGSKHKKIQLLNNAFTGSGGARAINTYDATPDSSYLSRSDYNNFYSEGTWLARYNNYSTIAILYGWKLATLKDSHSVSGDPRFASATDLHANSYYLDDKGTPINGIDTDIDLQSRSSSTPDIGADEFTQTAPAAPEPEQETHEGDPIASNGPEAARLFSLQISRMNSGVVLESRETLKGPATVRLYDLQGRMLSAFTIQASDMNAKKQWHFNVEQLAQSIYLCEVEYSGHSEFFKLIRY